MNLNTKAKKKISRLCIYIFTPIIYILGWFLFLPCINSNLTLDFSNINYILLSFIKFLKMFFLSFWIVLHAISIIFFFLLLCHCILTFILWAFETDKE